MTKPKDASFAIIIHDKKVLLFLRDNSPGILDPNCWQLPGGGIEEGETPFEGLRRELTEEVSYSPKNIASIGKYKTKQGNIANIYLSYVEIDEVPKFKHGGDEGLAIKFFAFDELDRIPLVRSLQDYVMLKSLSNIFENKKIPKYSDLGLIPF